MPASKGYINKVMRGERRRFSTMDLEMKSLSAVLEDGPTGIRFYIKVIPPKNRRKN